MTDKATYGPDYRINPDPFMQPYRHPQTGEVITFTPEQCAAIWHALDVYRRVVRQEAEKGTKPGPACSLEHLDAATTMAKSCLLGRLLHDGKAPLVDAPPVKNAAPDYSVEVPDATER